jgi:hypothetical protein
VTVQLYQGAQSPSNLIATTVTSNGPAGANTGPGYYQFTGLSPGSYTVVIPNDSVALAGYLPTPSMVAGSTPANDSNGSPASVTLLTGNDETIDFGYHQQPGISRSSPAGPVPNRRRLSHCLARSPTPKPTR